MPYIFISCPTSFGRAREKKKLEEKEEKRERGEGRREEDSWSSYSPSSLSILYYLLVADDILMNMDIILLQDTHSSLLWFSKNVFMCSSK